MDISSVGQVAAATSQAGTGDAVAILVLKKALDMQAQSALQLIQSLPQPASVTSAGGSVGGGVNTFA